MRTNHSPIPTRFLGKTGVQVSILGMGGYHLTEFTPKKAAIRAVQEAVDHGLTFMDNAWEYYDGESEKRMGEALVGRRDRVFLMTKLCSHGRDRKTAIRQLEQSLRRLKTDYLDLWQIHEVIYDNDPERHFSPDNAVEALEQAKKEGKVRFVGFTGHKDPSIHLKMLSYGYPFDTCQLPLNCFDASFRSFETHVLPDLLEQQIAPIGMKPLSGDGDAVKKKIVRAEDALRYAMSLPVATTITGIDSLRVLRQNLRIAKNFVPMTVEEMSQLRRSCESMAGDGRFELYKTSKEHDGPPGRRQHGFAVDH
jgi:aryl-alcohol dehydrogenase-like predicted oxidoreductase